MKKYKIFSLLIISLLVFQSLPKVLAKKDKVEDFASKKIFVQKKKPNYKYKDNEIVVKFKEDHINLSQKSGRLKAQNLEKNKGLAEIKSLNDSNLKVLRSEKDVDQVIEELKKDPNVEYAEPNTVRYPLSTPNDSYFNYQWALNNSGQQFQDSLGGLSSGTADADIDAAEAWNTESDSNSDIIVAVIDTGSRITHEDIGGNIWYNMDEIPGNGIDDDSNGYIDDTNGWDFKDNDNNPDDSAFPYCYTYAPDQITCTDEEDISGHGTMISGIIGAIQGNAKGISGISSKNKIRIMPIRFGLDLTSELQAIQYAKNNGAKVINASFGAEGFSQAEKNAIDAFPGVFVAAAGNETTNNEVTHLYPSDYTSANIISVAATDQNDALSWFSNYGNVSVDLGAPGENISSTHNYSNTTYAVGDGTSFAGPYVAASSAMILSAKSTLTATQVKDTLLSSGDSLPSLAGKTVSGKRLNLYKALQTLVAPAAPSHLTVF